jgi:NAD(P)-dependent dehydrogenase (short-subunit alcohol dehydrogenase family)
LDYELKGKVALVTGAARDTGREIALALGAEGATVAVNYLHSQADAEATVAQIKAKGGNAALYKADVTDFTAVRGMVDKIVKDHGRLDILVNNAGYVQRQRFTDTTPEDWKKQIDVGLYSVIHCCHAAVPHIAKQSGGRIINLVGDSARVGESGLAITAASRGGVLALTKSLAKELGRNWITVNAVALGLVVTSHSDPKWLEANMDKIIRNYPLRRLGKADDVSTMVAFLASEGASWVTGQVISVSGGFSTVG